MRKKYGKWYADWRDEHGQRKMKSFPSKSAALRHQSKMRREVAAKKVRAAGPSRKSPKRGPKASHAAATRTASPGS